MPSQKRRIRNRKLKLSLQNEPNETNEPNKLNELNEPNELNELNECNHNICNPYVRAWYDGKFKHAELDAFQLTKSAKLYYDDDGMFTCPICDKLFTVKGNNVDSK